MTSAWEADLESLGGVMLAWAESGRGLGRDTPDDRAGIYRSSYFGPYFSKREYLETVAKLLNSSGDTEWDSLGGYISPQSVEGAPALHPLLRLYARVVDQQLEVMLRVVTFAETPTRKPTAHGWRFESADVPGEGRGDGTGPNFHHYPHVQRIRAWELHGAGFAPPGQAVMPADSEHLLADEMVNESRPAFPLPCTSKVGVVVSAITSLYGAVETWRILESIRKPPLLRAEIQRITGISEGDFTTPTS